MDPDSQQNPTSTLQQNPIQSDVPPVKPNPGSNNLIILLVILVLLLSGASGYVLYQNVRLQNKIDSIKASSSPLASPTPVTNANTCKPGTISENSKSSELVDYKSDNCNISFSYPKDWNIYEDTDTQAIRIGDLENPASATPADIEGHTIVTIIMSKGQIPLNFPYTNGPDVPNKTITAYKINGYNGIRGKQTSPFGLEENVLLQLSNNEFVELVSTSNNKVFDQILSTFKFTQ